MQVSTIYIISESLNWDKIYCGVNIFQTHFLIQIAYFHYKDKNITSRLLDWHFFNFMNQQSSFIVKDVMVVTE